MVAPAFALVAAPLFELGGKLLDRWFPDPAERAKAEREFTLMMADREFKAIARQLEINAKEAAHPSIWVAGWRPFFGWIGGAGFLYAVILRDLLAWVARINGWPDPPSVDSELLMIVCAGLLGLGGLRTVEKSKGVSK